MNKDKGNDPQKGDYAPEPRVYELGYHLIPILGEEDVEAEREALVATISTAGGEIIDEGKPALIDLAYPMDKVVDNKRTRYTQAYFAWIKFVLPPQQLELVKKDVEREKNILRYLLIKTVAENTIFSENPYKLAKQSNQDDDFGDEDELLDSDIPLDEGEFDEEKIKTLLETPEGMSSEMDREASGEEERGSSEERDDLTKIEGIGPKISEILSGEGIHSFKDLAKTAISRLREILKKHKLSSHDPETWPEQAELARDGKWEELDALQNELKGGKRD